MKSNRCAQFPCENLVSADDVGIVSGYGVLERERLLWK